MTGDAAIVIECVVPAPVPALDVGWNREPGSLEQVI